jgi:hypothetical protein
MGHEYSKKYLEDRGYNVYVCPHLQVTWRQGEGGEKKAEWLNSGWNDAFAVPCEDNPRKKEGGFDIIALQKTSMVAVLVQVKKTKANPITAALKRLTRKSATYHQLPFENCYIHWWADGSGPERGGPTIWRADQD